MEEERPRISVVIPTRGRPEALRQCLTALEQQTVPVEVVVVEDVDGRGPAWARNEAVERAQGEIVCFTDDDCVPDPGWAQALTTPILSGEARATAGPVAMGPGATPADRAWEAIVAYLQGQATKPGTSSPGFAATANLACSRELMECLPFDESFPIAAGEDRDWAERVAREGAPPQLVPSAVVLHQTGMTVPGFLRRQYRYGRGAALYRSRGDRRPPGSPAFYGSLLRAGCRSGLRPGLLVGAAQVVTVAGALRETAKMVPRGSILRSRR
jgi:GT2 family glycosyltransferase